MNNIVQRTAMLVGRAPKAKSPAKAVAVDTDRPADRRLSRIRRLPVWRRGTLILVACFGLGFSALACSNPAASGGPDVTQLPAQTIMPGETSPANPTLAPTSGLGY
jgi:hypothetical protein